MHMIDADSSDENVDSSKVFDSRHDDVVNVLSIIRPTNNVGSRFPLLDDAGYDGSQWLYSLCQVVPIREFLAWMVLWIERNSSYAIIR